MDKKRLENLTLLGAIISGIVASSCCILPFILALFGIAGAGILSKLKFENTRPIFITITFVLLACAYYLTFRKRKVKCEDGTCKMEGAKRWNKIALYIATFVILLAILFPYFHFTTTSAPAQIEQEGETKEVTISVEGMVCEGCESAIKIAIKKLGGIKEVRADHKKVKVYVKFDSKKVDVEKIKDAINKAGFRVIEGE